MQPILHRPESPIISCIVTNSHVCRRLNLLRHIPQQNQCIKVCDEEDGSVTNPNHPLSRATHKSKECRITEFGGQFCCCIFSIEPFEGKS